MTQPSQPAPRARVLLIDRDPMVRAALTRMLDRTSDLFCIEAIDSSQGLLAHVQRTRADAVVIRMGPKPTQDLEAIRALADSPASVPLLACPDSPGPTALRDALTAGAAAIVTTADEPSTVLLAIREALAGNPFIAPKAAELLGAPAAQVPGCPPNMR